MMKYLNTEITFAEVPDEIALCINILGCDRLCKGCHSPFLWDGSMDDQATELTIESLDKLVKDNRGISCVCFMGGLEFEALDKLAARVHELGLRVAWYIYKDDIQPGMHEENFDYIKFGPYLEEFGGLRERTTNQRMFRYRDGIKEDITYKFWK